MSAKIYMVSFYNMGSFRDKIIECAVCGLLIASLYSHQCPNDLPYLQFSTFVKPLDNNSNLACEFKNGGIEPPETQTTTTTDSSQRMSVPTSGTASSTATGSYLQPGSTSTTTL